ncbi:hypothetical protein BO82DRAFT_345861 [Aspergillus uvarum CBS 121591]|uniref:Uncharacterized protein n=1 Tax=Aspergillus uvarum CBS 121591 TaxID=1448315 RepID=A0A319BY77_9EURO|nr:hypothetical protein BO82DRAFT_345861 [Aspergillus uvarum CBS 121591]PYH77107.1 hypothetical protein BO82DRAFT_345861 [Aspergillus uvarum CBS 121591]
MAGRNASYLSDARYVYDFVVATTQASINAGLWEFLSQSTQPVEYISFLSDPKTGLPTMETTLEELLHKTGGVNPFDIPSDTPYTDPRIKFINKARFAVGIKIQMGIPPLCSPSDSPPIVNLGSDASKVVLNMYCAQITVIQNHKDPYDDDLSSWNVWSQAPADPWIIQTQVDLVMKDLDKELNSSEYLRKNHKVREQLRKKLENLSGTAFSLHQLLFDLDNAVLQNNYAFDRVSDPDVKFLLETKFLQIYAKSASEHGWPLVAITAVSQERDDSTLQMTAFERTVNPVKDSSGSDLANPSQSAQLATTLDYVCVVDNKPVPPISRLGWNWVLPQDVGDSSGVIAINRDILTRHIATNLHTTAKTSCFAIEVQEARLERRDIDRLDLAFPAGSSHVIHMESQADTEGYQPHDEVNEYEGPEKMKVGAYVEVQTKYALDVFFEASSVRVVQHSQVDLSCSFAAPLDNPPVGGGPRSLYYIDNTSQLRMKAVDKTLTDTYSITVDQKGGLQLVKASESLDDRSDSEPQRLTPAEMTATMTATIFEEVRNDFSQLSTGDLHELEISQLQSFIFPGARVFTYKDPSFSDHQDLVCKITYLDPVQVSPSQPPRQSQQSQQSETGPVDRIPAGDSHCSPPPPPGTVGKLTASTELMQNYVQGEIISPTGKFEALQTSSGHALLFAVDTPGVFHVIKEQSGTIQTGWQIHDLSTAGIETYFPGQASHATVHTIDVGQSAADGSIGLMMAVNIDDNDHLFVSLGNSCDDTSWVAHPTWTMLPFDSATEASQRISITGSLFAETQDRKQYLVVDINRPQSTGDPHITRYHIDPSRANGHYWAKHDVAVDIASAEYQSTVGRISGQPVDGIYTAGTTGGRPQFVYEPIINYYGVGPVTPHRLRLPGDSLPSAIATAHRAGTDASTDLYAVGESTLYRFPADEQGEDDEPIPLLTSDILRGTDTLRAMTHDGVTVLWGRTASDTVYYLSCVEDQLNNPAAWHTPIPILSGVERISTYVNRTDGGNTVFASGNGRLHKLMQNPDRLTGNGWREQEIAIAVPRDREPLSFMSYVTCVQVTQLEKELPVQSAMVNLSASSRTPVYINGLYYSLSSTPIQVATDLMGSLTIVEATDSLTATALTVSLENTTLTINPMDKSVAKLTALDSAEKLRGARFPSHIVAGGIDGSPELIPLMGPSIGDEDVEAVATNMTLLGECYAKIWKRPEKPDTTTHEIGALAGDVEKALQGLGDIISTTAGDLFQALKHAGKSVGRIVYDTASKGLHMVLRIGETVYHAALDTYHAIVKGLEWVYNKAKAGLKELFRLLQALLEWGDIKRTKHVLKNITKLWLQDQVDSIPRMRQKFDSTIAEVEKKANEWANIGDWSSSLGAATTTNALSSSATGLSNVLTPDAKYLSDKYRDNAHQLTVVGDLPSGDGVQSLLNELITAVSNEGHVLEAVVGQLQSLASQFSSLSVEQVLQRLAVILVDGTLSSLKVVVDALLNVVAVMAQAALDILDTKIHIPVISTILNQVGISDLSFLDLFTYIGAVAVTVSYKIAVGQPPFPKHDRFQQQVSVATAWSAVEDLYQDMQALPSNAKKGIFMGCHMFSGVMVYVGSLQKAFDAEGQKANKVLGVIGTILGMASTATTAAADSLIPMAPIEAAPFKILSKITTAAKIGCKLVFGGLGQWTFGKVGLNKLVIQDARGAGAILDAALVPHAALVTIWHFYEISRSPDSMERSSAISSEVGKLANYIARVAYAVAVSDEEESSKQVAIVVMAAANDVYAGLLFAEAMVGGKAIG